MPGEDISIYDTCSLMNDGINDNETAYATRKVKQELKTKARHADRKNRAKFNRILSKLENLPEIKVNGGELFMISLEAIDISEGLERVQKGYGEALSQADADLVAKTLLYERAGYNVNLISADKAVQQTYEIMKKALENDESVEVA